MSISIETTDMGRSLYEKTVLYKCAMEWNCQITNSDFLIKQCISRQYSIDNTLEPIIDSDTFELDQMFWQFIIDSVHIQYKVRST